MDRAGSIDSSSWKVATVGPDLVPEAMRPDPDKAQCIIMTHGLVPQSFGCAKKEKADRMEGAAYKTVLVGRMDTSSGRLLEIVGYSCPCDSVIFCRHAIAEAIALSRLALEHYNTSTTTAKYWAGASTKRQLGGKPWRIGHAVISHKFLSDVHGGQLTDADLQIVTGVQNASVKASTSRVNRKRKALTEKPQAHAKKVRSIERLFEKFKDVGRMKREDDLSEKTAPRLTRSIDFIGEESTVETV
jgi:hypothetical protein